MPSLFPSALIQQLLFSSVSLPIAAPPLSPGLRTPCTQMNIQSTEHWHIYVICVCEALWVCVEGTAGLSHPSLTYTFLFMLLSSSPLLHNHPLWQRILHFLSCRRFTAVSYYFCCIAFYSYQSTETNITLQVVSPSHSCEQDSNIWKLFYYIWHKRSLGLSYELIWMSLDTHVNCGHFS